MSKENEGGWIILFLGTPYIDGVYSKKEDAAEVKKHFEERFYGIRFAMAFVEKDQDFYISDGIHWNRNEENISELNLMCLIANEHDNKLENKDEV